MKEYLPNGENRSRETSPVNHRIYQHHIRREGPGERGIKGVRKLPEGPQGQLEQLAQRQIIMRSLGKLDIL